MWKKIHLVFIAGISNFFGLFSRENCKEFVFLNWMVWMLLHTSSIWLITFGGSLIECGLVLSFVFIVGEISLEREKIRGFVWFSRFFDSLIWSWVWYFLRGFSEENWVGFVGKVQKSWGILGGVIIWWSKLYRVLVLRRLLLLMKWKGNYSVGLAYWFRSKWVFEKRVVLLFSWFCYVLWWRWWAWEAGRRPRKWSSAMVAIQQYWT